MRVTAEYEIEIPGDLVQKATTARMLNGDFQLSYSYVLNRLFPDIKNPMRERAQLLSDKAALDESNALIALIVYYRRTAAYLTKQGDAETARLYEAAAKATESMIVGQGQAVQPTQPARRSIGVRPESVPGITNQTVPMEATQGGQSSGSETTNSNPALTQ